MTRFLTPNKKVSSEKWRYHVVLGRRERCDRMDCPLNHHEAWHFVELG